LRAIQYYNRERENLGWDFHEELLNVTNRVKSHPERFSFYRSKKFRKAIVRRFPYVIYFRVQPTYIRIMAVVHHSRRPDYWIHCR